MTTTSSRPTFDSRPADLGRLIEKLPPQAPEAEIALLGSMILDHRVIGDVVQLISDPDVFANPKHGAIFQTLVGLYDENQSIDLVQLKQRLVDLELLDKVGGVSFLVDVADSVPHPANAMYYARIVHDKALIRRLIDAAAKILHDAHTSSEPAEEVLDAAEKAIFLLRDSGRVQDASKLNDLLQELYAQLESREGQFLTGLDSGFSELNEMTSGLQAGEMIIVAGRPSMGKTAYALNMAEHIAVGLKQPIAFFSLEMSRQQLAQRLLCSCSGVDSHKLRRNILNADDFAHLATTMGQLSDAPLFIDDTPGLSLLALRAKARRMTARFGIKAVFVDYLQLMNAPGSESRQQEVSVMSRGIKALARELNVPVVCLSQLNRSPEGREDHRPRMSDLRESGSIEQDADVVMMLHREEYYHNSNPEWAQENPDKAGVAELILAKQRNGPTGTVHLQFSPSTTRFNNLARESQHAAPF